MKQETEFNANLVRAEQTTNLLRKENKVLRKEIESLQQEIKDLESRLDGDRYE